jgi:hypothetical protein
MATLISLAYFDGTGGAYATDGAYPRAGLISDAAGDLFGTTYEGGVDGEGAVFEIANTGTVIAPVYSSTPTLLAVFNNTDGSYPEATLISDAAGDLFGTTQGGGTDGAGTVFEVSDTGFQAAPCYLAGTRIATPTGEVLVERLAIGDRVVTLSGAERPIKWMGRRSYGGRFVMGRKDILPICVKAGSLDSNVPRRDLWISPHHAMYLEGVLIEAKDLVNGVSIVQAEQVQNVEYFHIELDSHDVIIAEGAPSESFIDDDSRGMFHNAHEYRTLYPQQAATGLARYCAPRHEDGYEVEAARRRIALRAGLWSEDDEPRIGTLRGYVDQVGTERISGWAQNTEYPEAPVCLDIYAGGRLIGKTLANRYRKDLEWAGLGSGNHSFAFIPPAGLTFSPDMVEVRRSLDGATLPLSAHAKKGSLSAAA